MKKILFPTDFSDAANHAFIYALNVAKAVDADIVTLHVYNKPDVSQVDLPPSLSKIYETIDLEKFENYQDEIPMLRQMAAEQGSAAVSMTHVIEEGDIVDTITKVADKEGASVIIMGTKGAGWLKEMLFGTVAAEVMEHAPCPVLAIPKEANFDGVIDRIAITTEYTDKDVQGVNRLLPIAEFFDATVTAIHVDLKHAEDLVPKMDKWKSQFAPSNRLKFEVMDGNDLSSDLSEYLKKHRFDMIAMLTEKRSFWEELFHYSKAKEMVYHHEIPVLAIPVRSL